MEGTKWVARPHASISGPSSLVPVRPTYSPKVTSKVSECAWICQDKNFMQVWRMKIWNEKEVNTIQQSLHKIKEIPWIKNAHSS